MKSKSQAFQDIFVLNLGLQNKTYIEVGGYEPVSLSNTYNLEIAGWRGFTLEINTDYQNLWESCNERKNKVYWEDAVIFDYQLALNENNLSNHIGYLSCDIEPPENTFNALKKILSQNITIDCITFEHDNYQSNNDWDKIVTDFLNNVGYKVAVYNVYPDNKRNKKFETWYVHNTINFNCISFDDWKLKLGL